LGEPPNPFRIKGSDPENCCDFSSKVVALRKEIVETPAFWILERLNFRAKNLAETEVLTNQGLVLRFRSQHNPE
jgi:hypothetical protein